MKTDNQDTYSEDLRRTLNSILESGYSQGQSHVPQKAPELIDAGSRYEVRGVSSNGRFYQPTFLGENPFDNPAKYGLTEDQLLGLIEEAMEEAENDFEKLGHGNPGVLVVGPGYLVSPKPGVKVVHVDIPHPQNVVIMPEFVPPNCGFEGYKGSF